MNIQASIVISQPAEAVFAYLASEEHIAVLGQQGQGKRHLYNIIPLLLNPLQAQFQEMRRASEGEHGRGSNFVQVYTRRDKTFETSVVISVYELPRMLAFSISGQPFWPPNGGNQALPGPFGFFFNREPIWLSYVLIPLANGTRLTCTLGIGNPQGDFYQLLSETLLANGLGKGLKEDLGRLKDLLEGRPVPPRQSLTIGGPFKLDIRASIVIKRPVEAVFAHISEVRPTRITPEMQQERVERITRRFLGVFPYKEVHQHPAVKEIRQEPEGLIGVGTRFVQIHTIHHITYEMVTEISEYEPPHVIGFKVKPIHPRPQESAADVSVLEFGEAAEMDTLYQSRTVLEPMVGGTRVTETMYSEEGCFKLIAPFVAPQMRRQLQDGLREMKEELEQE